MLEDGYLEAGARHLFGESVADQKIRLPVYCFLIEMEGELILFDAGAAAYFGKTAGHLLKAFEKVGKRPEDVSEIYLTHLHPDHIGGLSQFPNATIFVSDLEAGYWLLAEREESISKSNLGYLHFVRNTIRSLEKRIRTFHAPGGLRKGIVTLEAYGHTPGHTAFLVTLDKEKLLIWGDTVHSVSLQFKHPGRLVVIDDNPESGAITRLRLLDKAATERLLVAGAHIGLGYVTPELDWEPLLP